MPVIFTFFNTRDQGLQKGSTRGTLYPCQVGTGVREDERRHAAFFSNRA